jgi:hypothetical protein
MLFSKELAAYDHQPCVQHLLEKPFAGNPLYACCQKITSSLYPVRALLFNLQAEIQQSITDNAIVIITTVINWFLQV